MCVAGSDLDVYFLLYCVLKCGLDLMVNDLMADIDTVLCHAEDI